MKTEPRNVHVLVVHGPSHTTDRACSALIARGHDVHDEDWPLPVAELDVFNPDAVVVELDGHDPVEMIERLRVDRPRRVLFVADAASTKADRVTAISAGADGVYVEPFDVDELVARIDAMMRWASKTPRLLVSDGLEIDLDAHVVLCFGEPADLTLTEFKLLEVLVRNVGSVMSKRLLMAHVWGFDGYDPNVVEVHISSLRKKLGLHGWSGIDTVRGVGYVIRRANSSR